jgi:hypothetical protein
VFHAHRAAADRCAWVDAALVACSKAMNVASTRSSADHLHRRVWATASRSNSLMSLVIVLSTQLGGAMNARRDAVVLSHSSRQPGAGTRREDHDGVE